MPATQTTALNAARTATPASTAASTRLAPVRTTTCDGAFDRDERGLGFARPLQRKCACGGSAGLSGDCADCGRGRMLGLQRRIEIGAADDPYEREADRVSDAIVAGNVSPAPRAIQRLAAGPTKADVPAPASVGVALAAASRPLEPSLRSEMEQRFGHDFSRVRIHSDAAAARSAHEVNAHAYTVGQSVVFGAGRFAPSTQEGRRLIAHELTHVVQQSDSNGVTTLRRQGGGLLDDLGLGDLAKDLAKAGEEEVRRQLRALGAQPGTGAVFAKPGCPSNFCDPFKDVTQAKIDLALTSPFLLAGVAKVVSPRAVPLWAAYLAGGSAPQNLTASFGADFTAAQRTTKTAEFIIRNLKIEIAANHRAIMGSAASVTVDLTPRMPRTLAAIDNQSNPNAMDFNTIGEIAGNIAGGIGKDQLANKIGAKPSPFDDSRTATMKATLTRVPGGINVNPSIDFEIRDTIDLCPGNCGAVTEQDATIPMSRFEATGLSGDVPFVVRFPAPPATLGAFTIPIAKAKPSPAKPAAPKTGTSGSKGAFHQATGVPEEVVAAGAIEDDSETSEEAVIASEESSLDDEQDVSV